MSQLKQVKCPVCEKGILTVVAEVGVEAHGTTAMFQLCQQLKEGFTDVIIVASHLSRSMMNSWN
jgi:hypothetical protein